MFMEVLVEFLVDPLRQSTSKAASVRIMPPPLERYVCDATLFVLCVSL
jgi:hypothetical protein